jgi:hypothetical protein
MALSPRGDSELLWPRDLTKPGTLKEEAKHVVDIVVYRISFTVGTKANSNHMNIEENRTYTQELAQHCWSCNLVAPSSSSSSSRMKRKTHGVFGLGCFTQPTPFFSLFLLYSNKHALQLLI